MIICPLCGFKFKEENLKKLCKSCPLSRFCNLVCCPNCGYSFPLISERKRGGDIRGKGK